MGHKITPSELGFNIQYQLYHRRSIMVVFGGKLSSGWDVVSEYLAV